MKKQILLLLMVWSMSAIYAQNIKNKIYLQDRTTITKPTNPRKKFNLPQPKDDVIKLKLDSVVAQYYKKIYEYDAYGNITKFTNYSWAADTFYINNIYEYTYDQNNNVVEVISYVGDGMIVEPYSKILYTYTTNNLVAVEEEYKWENDSWVKLNKYEYQYNSLGLITQSLSLYGLNNQWENNYMTIIQYLNDSLQTVNENFYWQDNSWIKDYKSEYIYNSYLDLIEQIYYNGGNDWVPNFKVVNEFYLDKHKIINEKSFNYTNNNWQIYYEILHLFDEATLLDSAVINKQYHEGNLINQVKYTYAYDNFKNQTLIIRYYWQNNTWTPDQKSEFIYNAQNLLSIELYSFYQSNAWVYQTKVEYYYNTFDQLTLTNLFIYDNNQWKNQSRDIYDYLPNGSKLILQQYQIWSETLQDWGNVYKYEYNYDQNLNETLDAYYEGFENTWIPEIKKEREFNLDVLVSGIVMPNLGWDFTNILTKETYFSNYNNNWAVSDIINYYYSQGSFVNYNSISQNSPIIYPNPTTDFVKINNFADYLNQTFEIYDINGRKLMQTTVKSNTITLPEITSGIYFYRIGNQTGKLLKK